MNRSPFTSTPTEVMENLQQLPATHTRQQIESLVEKLQEDLQADTETRTFSEKVHHWSGKHRELCLSYPMLYRTLCKGTFRPQCLDILLDVRDSISKGLPKEKGLEEMIRRAVDDVKSQQISK